MQKLAHTVLMTAAACLAAPLCEAADLHVPAHHATIQAAIGAAAAGDRVLVAPGTYPESINFAGKAIRVQGTGGSANTFLIAPSANSTLVTFATAETSGAVLDGFTILNSNGAPGIVVTSASPSVRNCIVQNCQLASGNGAALRVSGATAAPTFTNCYFIANRTLSGNGGAASLTGGVSTFDGCYFQSNEANHPTDCRGGAIHAVGAGLVARGCSFTNNAARAVACNADAFSRGGAVCIEGAACSMSDCTFGFNLAWGQRVCSGGTGRAYGGAVMEFSSQSAYVRCSFISNAADGGANEAFGGAMYFAGGADPTIDQCAFTNCRSAGSFTTEAGAIYYESGCAGTTSVSTFTGCTSGTRGGTLYMAPGSFPIVRDCTISNSTSSEGGGAYVRENATPVFLRTRFISCSASAGGGLHVRDNSNLLIDSCRFTGCVAAGEGGAICSVYAAIIVRNCIVQSNTSPSGSMIRAYGDTNRWPTLGNNVGCGNSGVQTNWIVGTWFDSPPFNTNSFVATCSSDCNANGISDPQEIAAGLAPDCNANGVPDSCDLASGVAVDCNANGRPDTCDVASGIGFDCNGNGTLDSCEIASGSAVDCNGNGRPDACDIASGVADCTGDGIPDSCQADCNGNGIADLCEVTGANDCNGNGVPDSCDFVDGKLLDRNNDGVPDSCQQLDFTGLVAEIRPITAAVPGLPSSAVCWRVYATFLTEGASVSGIFGDAADPLAISATGGFFQSPVGGNLGSQNPCSSKDPSLAYDSFLTIGGDCSSTSSAQAAGMDFSGFEAGGAIVVHPTTGGIVYQVPGAEAGAERRVLLMQLTTNAGVKPTAIFNLIGDNAAVGDDNEWYAFGMSIPDPTLVDCNGNGIHDAFDIATGVERDCDASGVPDSCEYPGSIANADCDADGVPDLCEILTGSEDDANGNGVPDACECVGDVDGNGVVNVDDLIEIIAAWGDTKPGPADLNGDGEVDAVDLALVLSGWGGCA